MRPRCSVPTCRARLPACALLQLLGVEEDSHHHTPERTSKHDVLK